MKIRTVTRGPLDRRGDARPIKDLELERFTD